MQESDLNFIGVISSDDFSFLKESHQTSEELSYHLGKLDQEKEDILNYLKKLDEAIETKLSEIRAKFRLDGQTMCHIIGDRVYTEKT